jgi:TonB family protein
MRRQAPTAAYHYCELTQGYGAPPLYARPRSGVRWEAIPVASPVSKTSHDSGVSDAASSGPQGSARAAAEVIAITTRDDFLLELGEAVGGGGQFSVRPVDSAATALEQIAGARRLQLLVVDARDTSDLRGDLDRIHTQAANLVTIVFTSPDVEKSTSVSLKGSNVFAVLPVPIDRRKTAAVFEGAVAEALARRNPSRQQADRSGGISVEAAQPERYVPPLDRDSGEGGKQKMIFAAGGALALLVIAAGAWFLTRDDAPKTPAAAAKPAAAPADQKASVSVEAVGTAEQASVSVEPLPVADTTVVQGSVDELLEKARFAMRDRRYTEPTGDNALLYYRSASAADPGNGEALDGLTRVTAVLASRFDEAVAAGRYEEAAQALVNFKSARPRDARIAGMDSKLASAQISKALGEGNVDRAAALVRQAQQSGAVPAEQITKWRNEINRRQDEVKVKRLVELALERVRDGRLIEPDNDNAKYYLAQLKELPGTNSSQQRVTRELEGAYLRKAREAGVANQKADYDRWVAEARSVGANAADITTLQREITAARQKASSAEADRLGQLARDRIREGKLTEPAQDSAAFYLTSLQSTDGNNAALAPASRELAAKLLERAGVAAREGKTAQLEADLALARRWGADPKDIQAVQAIPSARNASGNGLRQAGSVGSNVSLQNKLKRTRYVAPEFPDRALAQKVSGVVVVEFVVDVNGEPRDVRVVSAEPAGLFDRAAISAVKRWRYEAVIVEDVPTEVPARTSIRFALPKQ